MSRKLIVVIITTTGLLVAGLLYQCRLNRQTMSDHDQILTLLETAQTAVERTDARGTMAVVSRNYRDSAGLTYPLLRMKVADGLRSGISPDVILGNPAISVTGGTARVDLHVRVVDRGENDNTIINSDFTLLLRKERLRRHLVFVERQWRVASVEGLGRIIETY